MLKEEIIDLIEELERHWQLDLDKEQLLTEFFTDLKRLCGVVDTYSFDIEINKDRIEVLEEEVEVLEEKVSELESTIEDLNYEISALEEKLKNGK